MHLPTILYLGLVAVCVLAWVGAGRLVPARLLTGEPLLDALTRVAAGSVVVSLVVFGLGRARALDGWLLDLLTVAAALVGLFALPRGALSAWRGWDRLTKLLMGSVVLALLLDLVAATAPVTSADALKYHLALPKLWLQNGSIGDPFWRWEGFNPSGIEMLYTQGLALGGASTAAPLHAVLAAFCALAVFGLARELGGGNLAGAAAAFAFVLQGIFTWEATSSFIDLGLTLYAVLAVWHAVRIASSGTSSAAPAGFLSGAAAGTKYLGLVVAGIVLGFLAVSLARRGRRVEIAIAALAACLSGGAWYLKNAIETRSPFYPLFFGGKWLTPDVRTMIHETYASYGIGGGIARLPLLPYDLIAHGQLFDRGRYVGVGIFVLALLALVVRPTRAVVVLWLGTAVFLVAWHSESPQARFLLPGLAVLAAVGGAGAAAWLRGTPVRRTAVGIVLVASAAAWLAASVALTRQLLPVTVGLESRSAALQRLTGTYDAYVAVRARVGSGTVALVSYPFTFNFPGRAVTLDVPEFAPKVPRAVYVTRLRSLGVRSVLVGGAPADASVIDPIRSCLAKVATYRARFVTSRSLGQSTPYDLTLYSTVGCDA